MAYRLFGWAKAPTVSSTHKPVDEASSTSKLSTDHNGLLPASPIAKSAAVPQKSLKRKRARMDLYGKVVRIEVGQDDGGNSPRVFDIHDGTLCKHSGYFRKQLGDSSEQSERKHFKFPEHESEIFQYVMLWMYEKILYRLDDVAYDGDDTSPPRKIKHPVHQSEPGLVLEASTHAVRRGSHEAQKAAQGPIQQDVLYPELPRDDKSSIIQDEHEPNEEAEKQMFDSDPTLAGDDTSPTKDIDYLNVMLETQYYDVDDLAGFVGGDSAPISPIGITQVSEAEIEETEFPDLTEAEIAEIEKSTSPTEVTEPTQHAGIVNSSTNTVSATPAVPLTTLTLTKLYILAETLEMPELCNHVMALISQRLAYDKPTLVSALIYAFERAKQDSCICRVLIDYTARFASIDELLGHAEKDELSKELLVDLLTELGEIRDGKQDMGEWDEVKNVAIYKLPDVGF